MKSNYCFVYSINWKHIPFAICWKIDHNVYVHVEWYAWWTSSGLKNSLFLLTMIIKLEMYVDRANKYMHIIEDNNRNLITEEDYVRLSNELIMSSLSSFFWKLSSSLLLSSFSFCWVDTMFSHSNIKGK